MTDNTVVSNVTELFTVAQFVEKHPAFKIGGIRAWVFNEEQNQMKQHGVIKRVGRKVLIHEPSFFKWVNSQNGGNNEQ